jgi:hypothetical protein
MVGYDGMNNGNLDEVLGEKWRRCDGMNSELNEKWSEENRPLPIGNTLSVPKISVLPPFILVYKVRTHNKIQTL